jgi:serine/threonine-protein kinase
MIGTTIGGYQIIAKLGQGGMGTVYRGEHRRIARQAAIKVLLPELSHNQEVMRRFFNEARATSLIRHPGIVEILDCDLLPAGNAYIVMELLEGETLGSRLRRGERVSVEEALSLTRHIADALVAAHERGIVHRDLKPDNVFLLTGAGTAQPIKIVDFGIAKLMRHDEGEDRQRTRTGSLLGTPVYMSPEQCRGTGQVDHRTDIYSLGCVLFETLCGRPPFLSEGFGELIQAHLAQLPPPLRSIDPAFPPQLEALVARLLEKSPDERPQTMRALCAELDSLTALLGAPVAALPPPRSPPATVKAATKVLPAVSPPAAPPPILPAPAGGTISYQDGSAARAPVETTFRSGASELMAVSGGADERAGKGPITWSRISIAVALSLVAVGFGVWKAVGGSAADTQVALPPPPQSPQPQPPPHPQPPPPGPRVPLELEDKPPSATVTPKVAHRIVSRPSGATVYRGGQRIPAGTTPFLDEPPSSEGEVTYVLKLAGYRPEALVLPADRDDTREVVLTKIKVTPRPSEQRIRGQPLD